jgi:hypothetical protein
LQCLRKKVTSKKAKKRRDDVDYQLVKVGQNKVPKWTDYCCRIQHFIKPR